jgi:hypothetical protein
MSTTGSTAAAGRLARLSQAMMWVTTIGIGLIVVLTVLGFLIPDWTRNALLARLGQVGFALPLTPSARLAAAAIFAVPVGVMLWACGRCVRCSAISPRGGFSRKAPPAACRCSAWRCWRKRRSDR